MPSPLPARWEKAPYVVQWRGSRYKPKEFLTLRGASTALSRLVTRRHMPYEMLNADGDVVARSCVWSNGFTYIQFRRT